MQTYFICRHLKSGVNTSRFISGSLLQSTNIFDCCNTLLGIEGMLSALSQIILANVTFLISCSWHRVKAVLSVSRLRFGAFSCQKRSPSRRRLNCSVNIHWKVFPSAPPSASAGSSIPVKNHENNTCYKRYRSFSVMWSHFNWPPKPLPLLILSLIISVVQNSSVSSVIKTTGS